MQQTETKTGARKRCPMCGKAPAAAHRPFCSDRCSKLDLSKWLGGTYIVPGTTPLDGLDTADPEE